MELNDADLLDLKKAKQLLEKGGVAVSMGNWGWRAAERISGWVPPAWRKMLLFSTILAIEKSWEFSVGMMSDPDEPSDSEFKHKIYATLSGAIGGVAIPTLLAELPATTVIMFRSIADMARAAGENFHEMETRVACLQVFALGGEFPGRDAADSSYYRTRDLLERPMVESSKYIVQKGALGMDVPFLAQLMAQDCGALPDSGRGSNRRLCGSHGRGDLRSGRQYRFYESLPEQSERTFHYARAGTKIWSGKGKTGLSPSLCGVNNSRK